MRSDEFFGTEPANDGCTAIDRQGTINCGVETTLTDCNRGVLRNLNFSDLSDYFVWNKTSIYKVRNVSMLFRFDQPLNISRIGMWFWNAPRSSIGIPNLTLYSSKDSSTRSSNLVTIGISNSQAPVENERYRLNVDITDEGLMIHSLRIIMTLNEDFFVFLSEMLFCGKYRIYCICIILSTSLHLSETPLGRIASYSSIVLRGI